MKQVSHHHPLAAFVAAAWAFGLGIVPTAASVLVSNLTEPTRATTALSVDLWAVQAFATDGASYSLSSVEVLLGNRTDSPVIVAELHAQGGPSGVGATLASFTVPTVPTGSPTVLALTPNSAVTLDPTTDYWLVLGVSGTGSFGWSYAEGNATTGPGALGAYGYSTDAGSTWPSVTFDNPNPYQMRVQVTAVPEPASAGWLCGIALLCGIPVFRRRFASHS